MSYYIARTVALPFQEAVERTEKGLADEGFRIISPIDIQATLKAKIGVDFLPYTILGACNPKLAHEGPPARGQGRHYAGLLCIPELRLRHRLNGLAQT